MIANIECLEIACKELGIPYHFVRSGENFLSIDLARPYYFLNCSTPFNTQDTARICLDKDFTQKLLEPVLTMPKTVSFLDPVYTEFNITSEFLSIEEITHTAIEQLGLPMVVKMNSGSRRRNVHKCYTPHDVLEAFQSVYNQQSKNYDYIALAQEMIAIEAEYRVIVFNKSVHLVYEKNTFIPVRNTVLINKITDFLRPIYTVLDLNYGGIDLAVDEKGNLVLLEINSSPRFGPYCRVNGTSEIVAFAKLLLTDLSNRHQ